LISEGHDIVVIGRNRPPNNFFSASVNFVQAELGQNFDFRPVFEGSEYYIHAALDHLPHRFVGGEGDDLKGFALKNLAGTAALFKQAKKSGVNRAVFLSDMAVYGRRLEGHHFYETDAPDPKGVYAKVKFETEKILNAMTSADFGAVSLRLSSVYGAAGPGKHHKWQPLFKTYLSGHAIAPYAACEIHGEDVARAVGSVMSAEHIRVAGGVFNAMDMVVDRVDILSALQKASGCKHPLPDRFKADVSTMNCDKLKRLEIRTGGLVKLQMTLDRLMAPYLNAA